MSEYSLVSSHITDRTPVFSLNIHAGIAVVKRSGSSIKRRGGGIRGSVRGFSRQSRKRMLESLAKMRGIDKGYFVTLTYPGEFRYTFEECKSHIAALRKRLLRAAPDCFGLWRMEIKCRQSGASKGRPVPHFHILLFGVKLSDIEKIRDWFRRSWDEIANYRDESLPRLITDVDEIHNHKHAVSYAAKYAAKAEDDATLDTGRVWGVFGKFDMSVSSVIEMTPYQLIEFRRHCMKHLWECGKTSVAWMIATIREDFGFSVFGIGDNEPGEEGIALAIGFAMASVT